jgi:hypothetical protein
MARYPLPIGVSTDQANTEDRTSLIATLGLKAHRDFLLAPHQIWRDRVLDIEEAPRAASRAVPLYRLLANANTLN